MTTAAIYARVSTGRQDTEIQLAALRQYAHRAGYSITKEYIDHASGKNTNRPAFKELMADARRRKFKILLVWKLDRLGRSLKDLVNTLDEMGQLGIEFFSHQDNLDTSTPSGKLLFHVMASIAEFERELIRERVCAGVANARNKGKRLGRPGVDLDPEEIAAKKADSGLSNRALAKQYKISEATIRNLLNGGANKAKPSKSLDHSIKELFEETARALDKAARDTSDRVPTISQDCVAMAFAPELAKESNRKEKPEKTMEPLKALGHSFREIFRKET